MALRIETVFSPGVVAAMRADRRLCLTADRTRVVEAGDAAAAFLFAPAGDVISSEDAARYQLTLDANGYIVLPGTGETPRRDAGSAKSAGKKPAADVPPHGDETKPAPGEPDTGKGAHASRRT